MRNTLLRISFNNFSKTKVAWRYQDKSSQETFLFNKLCKPKCAISCVYSHGYNTRATSCINHSGSLSKLNPGKCLFNNNSILNNKNLVNNKKVSMIDKKCFHTSKPNHAIPGFVYVIFKPILRVGAILLGRMTRKWWSKLTPEQKLKIISKLKRNQTKIFGITLSSVVLFFIYYFLNQEICPITGRQKFIIINSEQMKDVVQLSYEAIIEEHSKNLVPTSHWAYQRVAHVVRTLLLANKEYMESTHKKFNYSITIIDDPMINAFVLPDGRIFIFTGMLKLCPTDNELATVLSHELSHTLLNHVAEKLSNKTLIEILFIVPLLITWFLLPDLGAIVTQFLLDDLKTIMFELPFDRDMETEADEVGLKLMARACYDVRVASLFWSKMHEIQTKEKEKGAVEIKEFLSTHPSHESRQQYLDSIMKEAIETRKQCNCPPLGPLVPYRPFLLQRFMRTSG